MVRYAASMHLTLKVTTILCMGGPLTTVKKGDYYGGETKGTLEKIGG